MCAPCCSSKDPLRRAAYALVLVGGLNWGLVGLFQFDVVQAILGFSSFLTRVVYILVGVSAVYLMLGKTEHEVDSAQPSAAPMPPSAPPTERPSAPSPAAAPVVPPPPSIPTPAPIAPPPAPPVQPIAPPPPSSSAPPPPSTPLF